VSAPAIDAPECTSEDIDGCTRCGRIMHRRHGPACREGHSRHSAYGACKRCTDAPRKAERRGVTRRDRLMRAWADLAEIGVGFDDIPRHVGMTYPAWKRAFYRARDAGHPLARRFDLET
jgi:hypothetical protein